MRVKILPKNLFSKHTGSLLRELVITDFKLRYQGSVLGYLWSFLRPLMLFTVLYFVFTRIFRLGGTIPYYPAYLLLGVVMWAFFAEATSMGMQSIVARGELIRKVSLPKYTIVLASVISSFINLCLNLAVVAVFMFIAKVPIHIEMLALPIFLVLLMALALAAAFLLSALYVRFRDFSHIWDVTLQVLFYATPILYPLTLVPERLAKILVVSPLAYILQNARAVTITDATLTPQDILPPALGHLLPLLIIGGLAVVSVWYFRKNSAYFAENL